MAPLLQQMPAAAANDSSWWKYIRRLLLLSSFLGLGSLNLATLVSDELHAAGYNALKSILGAGLTDATLTKLLSHSTTAKRTSDVAQATRVLMDEKAALSASHRSLTDKHAALELAHKDISGKHVQLQQKSASQAAVVQKVSKRIATRSIVSASRNVSSLPGEAIPVLGTALVVGVTAWDIYDLCETIKDMNEINGAFGHPSEDQQMVCGMKVPTREQVMADARGNWQAAYKSAADSINQAGNVMVSASPPSLSWADMKGMVCPIVGTTLVLCK